jgi:hypothetical protein
MTHHANQPNVDTHCIGFTCPTALFGGMLLNVLSNTGYLLFR